MTTPKVRRIKAWAIQEVLSGNLARKEHDNGVPFLYEDKQDALDNCRENCGNTLPFEKPILVEISYTILPTKKRRVR